MTHASVFSGIGGPEVAATMLGWDNLFHCEINPFGKRVLDYWYPNAKSYDDITTTDFSEWRGKVNVLTGGFPCQPFSCAGQRRGADDDRYLWPFMFKCIDQIQPDWVVAENVSGILSMVEQGEITQLEDAPTFFDEDNPLHRYEYRGTFTLERICNDLESHGYEVQPILIPACAVGAPHRRDRVFIVAHTKRKGTRSVSGEACDEGRTASENWRESLRQAHGQACSSRIDAAGSDDAPNTQSLGQFNGDRKERGAVSGRSHLAQTERSVNEVVSVGESGYASDANSDGHQAQSEGCGTESERENIATTKGCGREWPEWTDGLFRLPQCDTLGIRWADFPTVAPVHRGNDGIPFHVDSLTIPFGKWRNESIKAYGNAIVPQVMYEIFRAIEQVQQQTLFQV